MTEIFENDVWVERVGAREYIGRNHRGGEVRIASAGVADSFNPGELLKLALIGCSGLSTDVTLGRILGENYPARIGISAQKVDPDDRYDNFVEQLELDLSALSEEEKLKLLAAVQRVINKYCTVGNTVKTGAAVEIQVTDATSGDEVTAG